MSEPAVRNRRGAISPVLLAKLLVVRARLEGERASFEAPRIKAAIARTKGSGRAGTYKGLQYWTDRAADTIDRQLYESGLSGVTRWKRNEKPARKGKAAQ